MHFRSHSNLQGLHAKISASKYHWINYDAEKMTRIFLAMEAAKRGTELHDFASMAIRLGRKMPETRDTLNMYVNDAIGYRMTPEQILYVSDNAFGTADAISFRSERRFDVPVLRIHDLKTGVNECSFYQLMIYAAFFSIEYGVNPFEIYIELRLYQNDDVQVLIADPGEIVPIMEKAKEFDQLYDEIRMEALL